MEWGEEMSLKKQLIKNYLKMQLISNEPGRMKIRIGNLPKLDEKYETFESSVIELLKILPGITNIETAFGTGDMTINYNQALLTPKQVMRWINVVVDVAIDNMNFISTNWESNLPYVMNELRRVLEGKAKAILGF